MPALPAPEVALLLREFGQRTALRGGNPYRSKAYTRAAENLLALTEPLEDLVAEGRLTEIPGVGDAIADIITKLHKTGDHPSLQSMRKEMPATRKGGVPADRVLNALTLSQLMQHLKRTQGLGLWRAKNDSKEQAMPAMLFSRKLQRPARGRIRSTAIAGR
jgi:DNA polymerase/3'-5' exonuclease PolX